MHQKYLTAQTRLVSSVISYILCQNNIKKLMKVGFCTLSSISVKQKYDSWWSIFISGIFFFLENLIIWEKSAMKKYFWRKWALKPDSTFANCNFKQLKLICQTNTEERSPVLGLKNQRPQFVLIRSYGVPLRGCCQGYNVG